ncbi:MULTISPECIES: hypothetical protein [Flavobacterium]|uniref:hypothetical protein n=1 Tax=Flavobacterium TaxID=237 RepID=UPI001FCBDC33|nr:MULTISPECIES: hypothetical protein [Flavobacterium]UOK42210.1 hypothetical protein LZF87_12935 [Flavobacterium enshiense]
MEYLPIIAIIISVVSPFINLWLNERIKASVNHHFNKEISKFEKEIEVLKSKETFKFTKLHEKRLEVLENTYSLVNSYYTSLNNFLHPLKIYNPEETSDPNKRDYEQYAEAYKNLFDYFSQKKIYYDVDLEKQIENFIKDSHEATLGYTKYIFYDKIEMKKEERIKAMTSYKEVPIQILPLKEKLEERFREVLEK